MSIKVKSLDRNVELLRMAKQLKSSSAREQLWNELADLFAEDDGGLPEFQFVGGSVDGAVRIFETLRDLAEPLRPDQKAWDSRTDEEVPLAAFPDAPRVAASGETDSIHVLLSGIHSCQVRLPDLGLTVAERFVALD